MESMEREPLLGVKKSGMKYEIRLFPLVFRSTRQKVISRILRFYNVRLQYFVVILVTKSKRKSNKKRI